MFGEESRHPAVKIVKSFLNASSKTPVNNLKTNDSFDSAARESLANFQKSKDLSPTGLMDLKTWFAIGAEMNPIQIKEIWVADRTAGDLLLLGYRSKLPFFGKNPNNPLGLNGKVQTKSPIGVYSAENNFTFTVYVTAFAPFDWFGPLNASRGDGKVRRF